MLVISSAMKIFRRDKHVQKTIQHFHSKIVHNCSDKGKDGTGGGSKNLYLTPFIESDKLEEGRTLAEVTGLNWPMKSYSGLLTVNKTLGSNMFFWYFPSENKPDEVPLLLWLNGMSTASSYGVFLQNGPYDLLTSSSLTPRSYSWQKSFNVLYIDNPIGVGFSFTGSDEGYSTHFDSLSSNLHEALMQFLKLFPSLARRELYLTGLSLAGKFIPALANAIYKEKSLNMKGIFLGNPLIHPVTQIRFGEYLYQHGFVDRKQKLNMDLQEKRLMEIFAKGDHGMFLKETAAYAVHENGYILKATGIHSIYDYSKPYIDPKYYLEYINNKNVKNALHVGETDFNNGDTSVYYASKIFADSSLHFLEEIVEDIPVFIYAGETDVVCAYPMIAETLSSMNWTGKDGYRDADRELLRDDSHVWGYKKNYKTLTDVLVRDASHSAVTDKPRYVWDLLIKFTNYIRFM